MNDSIYRISLDIHEHGSQTVLKAKKTDTGRKLHISLRAGGTPYIIADDCYAVFKATKPDDSILYNACTIENNEIIYEFSEQTCTSVGRCRCEIALYGLDDKLITSPRFSLLVDGTIYPDGRVESSDEFSALAELVSETLEVSKSASEAAENATEATQGANDATERANEATSKANEATQKANVATKNANEATATATRATVEATQATQNANTAAGDARDAAEYAEETALRTSHIADEASAAADKAIRASNACMVIGKADDTVISVDDAIEQYLGGLRVFGKTTQNGTPTPDAPVELVSAGKNGAINVFVTGKNLLAEPFVIGVYRANGYGTNEYVISTKGMYLSAGTYAISASGVSTCNLYVNGMIDATHTSDYQVNYGNARVIEILEDGLYNVQFNTVGGALFTDAELQVVNASAQLEFGATATEYEPYKGQTATLSTPNGLLGIGEYRDEIDFARGVYVHRVEFYSFAVADMNGSESYPGWRNAGIAKYYPNASNAIGRYGAVAMCNIESNPGANVHINTKDGSDVILMPNPNGMAQSEWKAQYPNLVFELIVSIPTPIETPLTEEELAAYKTLHTYKDHTTVSNDAGARMELEYVMDAKKYIDGLMTGTILPARVE